MVKESPIRKGPIFAEKRKKYAEFKERTQNRSNSSGLNYGKQTPSIYKGHRGL